MIRTSGLCALAALGLTASVQAIEHPVSVLGRVYIDTNCNGVIDSHDVPVNGVGVALQRNGAVLGIAKSGEFGLKGVYAFPSDMAPVSPNTGTTYTLTLNLPSGFEARNAAGPAAVSQKLSNTALRFNLPTETVGTSSSYDFLIKQTCPFYTDDECGWGDSYCVWGSNGCGYNNGCWGYFGCGNNNSWYGNNGWGSYGSGGTSLLRRNFTSVYDGVGVTIGGIRTLRFTSSSAIRDFLPQSGQPKVLAGSAVNSKQNFSDLAAQVLCVQLNVDFSDAGITTGLLGESALHRRGLRGLHRSRNPSNRQCGSRWRLIGSSNWSKPSRPRSRAH